MRYDRARKNLDRHPNYILAAYMASGTPSCLPSTRPVGSGPPSGPPRQADLDGWFGRWRAGRWSARLARVDGRRDGLPQPPTDLAARRRSSAFLEPERPRRRRSNRNPHGAPARRRTRRALLHTRGSLQRGPVGCRPTSSPVNGLSFCGGPPGFPTLRASRRASGVSAAERQRQRPARAQAAARAARSGPP
jgi:hypothetical protein